MSGHESRRMRGYTLPPHTGVCPYPALLCSESLNLFFSRALAQSSEDEGAELLGVRPPKRPPSPESGNFLLPPLSLVCLGVVGILWSQILAGLNLLFYRWETREGQGLAEGQAEGQRSSRSQDLDLLVPLMGMKRLCKYVISAKKTH